MPGELAPADREDVPRAERVPALARLQPAVEGHENLVTLDFFDGSGTDEVRVLGVHGLQLLASLELVLERFEGRRLEAVLGGEDPLVRGLDDLLEELGPFRKVVAEAERRLDLAAVSGRVAVGVDEVGVDHEPEVVAVIGAV